MVTQERLAFKSNRFDSPGRFSLYSRREFIRLLGLGSLLVYASGCTPQFEIPFIGSNDQNINRNLGVWTERQIEILAKKMLDDSKLDQIALAGQVLLDNQQSKPSLSRLSPVFLDNKFKITTVGDMGNAAENTLHVSDVIAKTIIN